MEVKLFNRTQRHLASSINEVIDRYWQDEIKEPEMINMIQTLYEMNKTKMMKNGQYTTVIRQQCGKKRLEVVSSILHLSEKAKEPTSLANDNFKF